MSTTSPSNAQTACTSDHSDAEWLSDCDEFQYLEQDAEHLNQTIESHLVDLYFTLDLDTGTASKAANEYTLYYNTVTNSVESYADALDSSLDNIL